jgi:hypothetical protein
VRIGPAAAAGVSSALRADSSGLPALAQVVKQLSLDNRSRVPPIVWTKGPVDGYDYGSGLSVFLQHPRQTILDNPIRMHEA